MKLVLTVEVPSIVAVELGRYRRVTYVPGDCELNSRVRAVRRIVRADGTLESERVEVEVFVPEERRRAVEAPRSAWITPEYLRCKALVSKNRKSLAAFLDSGDRELTLAEES
ncbi:hypothetical protein [Paraburkholderia silvatlantica]|uniref:Uncharacterized protein n=1 Tax=Paraburkholderia silvatlantica TaxID=321895 RepID=A0ABR6FLR6_9BURK|nr:hypothetical protein [Paraburkholderia silvatlantica]MBB2928373.1 hypothetical protein [Paraburkholderia silvatlantica]PVY34582.1 hypothetical protein C7411_107118 [Paraburkholderia silvatlantica]PXW38797.1 hypothetical protein C7413_107118 [Paraburkholderia silvatlantica]